TADSEDYRIAYHLMLPILRRTFAPLSERALALLGAIKKHALSQPFFGRADAARWGGVGLTEARNRLSILLEGGLIELVTGGKAGVRCTYRLLGSKNAQMPGLEGLITPEELKNQLKKKPKKDGKSSKK